MRTSRYQVYQRLDDLWDWRLLGKNGEIICQSNQGFRDRHDAKRAIKSARWASILATTEVKPKKSPAGRG